MTKKILNVFGCFVRIFNISRFYFLFLFSLLSFEDETVTGDEYKITPVGPEFDNETTGGGSNNNCGGSGTTGGNGNGSDRDAFWRPMLRQRRVTGVLKNNHLHHGNTENYFHLEFDSKSLLMAQFHEIKWVLQIARRLLKEFPQFGARASFDRTQERQDNDNSGLDEFGIESNDHNCGSKISMILYYLLQKSQLLNGFLFLKIQSLYLRIQFNQEHQNQNGQESKLDISLYSTYNAESANTFERRPSGSSPKNKKQSKVKPNHKAIA